MSADGSERQPTSADAPRLARRRSATSRSPTSPARRTARRCAAALKQVRTQLGQHVPAGHRRPAACRSARRSTVVEPVAHRARSSARSRRRPSEQANAGGRRRAEGVRRLARHAGRGAGRAAPPRRRRSSAQRRFELAAWNVYETRQAVARGRRRRRRGHRLLRLLRGRDAAARRAAAPRRARRGQRATSTSRAASPSSSRRGTSRSPSSPA